MHIFYGINCSFDAAKGPHICQLSKLEIQNPIKRPH